MSKGGDERLRTIRVFRTLRTLGVIENIERIQNIQNTEIISNTNHIDPSTTILLLQQDL